MKISNQVIERIIFRQYKEAPRFTQDSPVYPDVWLVYFDHIHELKDYRQDLILTPHFKSNAAELFKEVNERLKGLKQSGNKWKLASNGATVVACLTFYELVTLIIPFSSWWQRTRGNDNEKESWLWGQTLVGAFMYAADHKREVVTKENNPVVRIDLEEEKRLHKKLVAYFEKKALKFYEPEEKHSGILYSVSRNRTASITIQRSIGTTKADAGRRLFDVDGSEIVWAVLDSGIDARNWVFRKTDPKTKKPFDKPFGKINEAGANRTRIVATYDFTRFREKLTEIHESINLKPKRGGKKTTKNEGYLRDSQLSTEAVDEYEVDIAKALKSGRALDWSIIAPLLRIPHSDPGYEAPKHPHGTHVAGIIGACEKRDGMQPFVGMCPGIELYDIRVMNEKGEGEEFNILAGLHFVRWLNNQKDNFAIHGLNLSFSMTHDVASYACGQTPVCEACERLVAEGAVVVAAAGNLGQAVFTSTNGTTAQGFRMVNITDPGNAESVITVGATHRFQPHTYGVSYFSSKGPTGDGRLKPDLVAPGEKITSCVISDATQTMDGTSMASPHVSGAAALLLAKYRELIGSPAKVKEILCKTATDLGREKYFQGHGMVDVLRAIQSV